MIDLAPMKTRRRLGHYNCICVNPKCKSPFVARTRTARGCSQKCRLQIWRDSKLEADRSLREKALADNPAAPVDAGLLNRQEKAKVVAIRHQELVDKLDRARALYAVRPSPGLANNIFLLNERLSSSLIEVNKGD